MERKANVQSFIKKWDGVRLHDAGSYVSDEFRTFQRAFFAAMRKIAKSVGGEVVNPSYGHYDMSGFVKRGDKFVYFNYSNIDRTMVRLTEQPSYRCVMYVRTAEDEKDYRGGRNHNVSFENCEWVISKLLDEEHKRV